MKLGKLRTWRVLIKVGKLSFHFELSQPFQLHTFQPERSRVFQESKTKFLVRITALNDEQMLQSNKGGKIGNIAVLRQSPDKLSLEDDIKHV